MDFESRYEEIRRAHAASEARWEKRLAEHESRITELDRKLAKDEEDWRARARIYDQKLEATRKLLEAGMKMVVKINRETDFKLKALIDAQQRNEELFKRWFGRNRNGHST